MNHAFAVQLNCFTQLRALLVLHDRSSTIRARIIIIIIMDHAYAGQLIVLTQI
jgi:hypothetical protein